MLILALSALALGACGVVLDRTADLREAEAEARYPATGRLIDVNGVTVHAHIAGRGPDLVLLHGASGNTRDFTFAFVDQLTDRYRVIVFDRPGLGWTGRSDPAYSAAWRNRAESPAEQAALLQAAADQLGVRRPIVLGHSYGGAVALAWGLARPDDTAALVIVSGASNPWPGGLGAFYGFTASGLGATTVVPLITAVQPYGRLDAALTRIFAPDPVPPGYARYVGAGLSLRRDSLRANTRQVSGLKPHLEQMAPRYGSLPMPVEILHGTADKIVPLEVHSEPLSRQIPGARLTRLDGVGHMPHHARPAAVAQAIDRAAARARLR